MRNTFTLTAAAAVLGVGLMASAAGSASAAPLAPSKSVAQTGDSLVEQARCWRRCWWSHGRRYCSWRCYRPRWHRWHRW